MQTCSIDQAPAVIRTCYMTNYLTSFCSNYLRPPWCNSSQSSSADYFAVYGTGQRLHEGLQKKNATKRTRNPHAQARMPEQIYSTFQSAKSTSNTHTATNAAFRTRRLYATDARSSAKMVSFMSKQSSRAWNSSSFSSRDSTRPFMAALIVVLKTARSGTVSERSKAAVPSLPVNQKATRHHRAKYTPPNTRPLYIVCKQEEQNANTIAKRKKK